MHCRISFHGIFLLPPLPCNRRFVRAISPHHPDLPHYKIYIWPIAWNRGKRPPDKIHCSRGRPRKLIISRIYTSKTPQIIRVVQQNNASGNKTPYIYSGTMISLYLPRRFTRNTRDSSFRAWTLVYYNARIATDTKPLTSAERTVWRNFGVGIRDTTTRAEISLFDGGTRATVSVPTRHFQRRTANGEASQSQAVPQQAASWVGGPATSAAVPPSERSFRVNRRRLLTQIRSSGSSIFSLLDGRERTTVYQIY